MQLNARHPSDSVVIYQVDSTGGAATPGQAQKAVVTLTQRHSVLRTLFYLPPLSNGSFAHWEKIAQQAVQHGAGPTIRKLAAGPLSPLDALEAADAEYNQLPARDSWSRFPAWFIYRQQGGGWSCLIAAEHLFLDGVGAARLSAEYQALLRGVSTPDLPAVGHPFDLAAIERGPRGVGISGRNLARMTTILESAADDQIVSLRDAESVYTSMITSSRLYEAINRIATRWHVPRGGVAVSLIACATWERYTWSPLLLKLLVRVPVMLPNVAYVGLNTTRTLLSIPVDPAIKIDGFGRLVWAACVDASRYCAYDPVALAVKESEIARRLGRNRIDGLVHINYHAVSDVGVAAFGEEITQVDRRQGPTADRTMYDVAVDHTFARLSVVSATDEVDDGASLVARVVNLALVIAAGDDAMRLKDLSEHSD